MARQAALYEVTVAGSGEVISRHRTRQAAVDAWRANAGTRIEIYRLTVPSGKKLIAEGVWHEATRPG